jgi:hypothetical protein
MKKILLAFLFTVLSLGPAALACDPSYPQGVHGALTINIPSCTADNYNAPDAYTGCDDIRKTAVDYMNSVTAAGTTFTYINDKNEANFIVYVIAHEVSSGVFTINLKTYGMGKTGDGHTLFTIVGKEGDVGESALDAYTKFVGFINDGWYCNK